jgi:hypothetical protein
MGKASTRERNKRFRERRSERDVLQEGVGLRKKPLMQQAAWRACRPREKKRVTQQLGAWACCQREKEANDSVSGTAGKALSRERNERFSEWHIGYVGSEKKNLGIYQAAWGQVVVARKKRAIQRTAQRAYCQR